ncbi:MAG: Creatinine amidohydrolase [Enterovirga sp.]|nr:Creatinine amidohydrolase [Enterovirga sp.]
MTEVFWNRLKASDLRDLAARDAIVLLPVASTEQHGPHLATGVDVVLCTEACRRAAQIVARTRPIVVAPTVWMGLAEHHVALGGTFSVSLTTWHAILRELCQSIVRAGFRKIVIVNGHGGNVSALNALTIDLTRETGAPIATTNYFSFAAACLDELMEDQDGVQHACEGETSMMMAAAPDLVDTARLGEAHGPNITMAGAIARTIHVWKSFGEMTPSGVLGDARRASPEKGERLLDAAAQGMADAFLAGEPWA